MPTSADNAKKAKIKSEFKAAFYQYQDWEAGIKAARILKETRDMWRTQSIEVWVTHKMGDNLYNW
jgi:hypothetical protein